MVREIVLFFFDQLEMNSNMCLEVAFQNEKMSVWESLVEPVVENGKMKKWDLELKVGIKIHQTYNLKSCCI